MLSYSFFNSGSFSIRLTVSKLVGITFFTVWVVADAAAFIRFDTVLVDYPR